MSRLFFNKTNFFHNIKLFPNSFYFLKNHLCLTRTLIFNTLTIHSKSIIKLYTRRRTSFKYSLQIHNFRSEHWIVLEGIATILINKNKITLKKSESTYVPQKTEHKVTNNTDKPLIILETQLGKKLSENDIIRIEDDYGR